MPMLKRKVPEVPTAAGDTEGTSEDDDVEILSEVSFSKRPMRLQGNKAGKEHY
jgi:hypothetical protein